MNLIKWIEEKITNIQNISYNRECFLSIRVIRILCKSRLLQPKDVLSLAATSFSIFQSLAHYISGHYWFRLAPQPYVHYKPSKLRVDFRSPYMGMYITNFARFFPFLTSLDLVAEDYKYLLFTPSQIDQVFFFELSLTTLYLYGEDQSLGRLPPTLHTLVLRGTFKELNFTFQNLPQLTNLDIQGKKRGLGGMHTSAVLADHKFITFLPPSLTHLVLPHNSINPHTPPTLPPCLLSLHLSYGHESHSKSPKALQALPFYPRTLQKLVVQVPSLPLLNNIPPALSYLKVSSLDFNQELTDLPPSLTHLTIHTHPHQKWKQSNTKHVLEHGFDKPLDGLPTNLKVLKLFVAEYSHSLNLPPKLTTFKFYAKSYNFPLGNFPSSITQLCISLHHFPHPIKQWPANLQKLVLRMPDLYEPPLPPFPLSLHNQNSSFCHVKINCWCETYEVKRFHQLRRRHSSWSEL